MLEQLEKLQQKGRASVEPTQPIYIQSSGTVVGKMEGEGPLASYFDMICDTDKFGEETWEAAESRMQKEAVTLAGDTPRGYVLLTYGGHPLGFAKNVGNRANNLYPNEWRIRSGYLPGPEETALVCGWLGAGH